MDDATATAESSVHLQVSSERAISRLRHSTTASEYMIRLIAAVILVSSLMAGVVQASAQTTSETVAQLTPFPTIKIFGDDDFNATNGVSSGSGTSDDPYVIEGLEIDGIGATTCIWLVSTVKHVVIRDCVLKNGSFGVKMQEVENVRVDNCIIEEQTIGIRASYSDKSAIVGNTISGCDYGVYIYYSEGVRVEDNTYFDNESDYFEEKPPWEMSRVGTYICIALAIPLAIALGLLLYMRLGPPRKGVVRPPVE